MYLIDEDLSRWGNAEDTKVWILVAQFNGASGVGGAVHLVIEEMLRSLPMERVAISDTGAFLDYRFHQPLVTVSDWVLKSVEMPEFVLDRVEDDLGNPTLTLHGAGPDTKWESFSRIVTELTTRVGIEIVVSFNGVSSGVSHTRPTPVYVQATEKALIFEQPQMAATLRFPALMTTFLQERPANQGVPGIVFLAAIPFYVVDTACLVGTSALLSALPDLADLSLPVGELEQDVAEEYTAIEQTLESNSEMQRVVAALEEHFDALSGAGKGGVPPGGWAGCTPLRSERKTEKDTGGVIGVYLVNFAEQPEKDEAEEA